jgi:hypothetical protein
MGCADEPLPQPTPDAILVLISRDSPHTRSSGRRRGWEVRRGARRGLWDLQLYVGMGGVRSGGLEVGEATRPLPGGLVFRYTLGWRLHAVGAVEGEEARHNAWAPSSAATTFGYPSCSSTMLI